MADQQECESKLASTSFREAHVDPCPLFYWLVINTPFSAEEQEGVFEVPICCPSHFVDKLNHFSFPHTWFPFIG